MYDLTGIGKAVKLDLFYTTDNGVTWSGPLKYLSGEISNVNAPAKDKRIVWDALTEVGEIKGNMRFRITADFSKVAEVQPKTTSADFRKHKTQKGVWLASTLVSSGIGLMTMGRSNKLYDEYQTAQEDAADIHKKIETLDIVTPIAFGVAGISALNFIIQAGKQAKAKKQISFHPLYLPDGGGATLTFKF
ncbi:MAG TPA: hypothetical protein PK509_09775 [Catalimonadaceae bacterium]|nr:hypothetical protein [Catalimonadaceae bacterium]